MVSTALEIFDVDLKKDLPSFLFTSFSNEERSDDGSY